MSDQLSNCKITINSVVSIATLYSSVRHCHLTEDIRKTISIKQAEVKDMNLSDDDEAAGSWEGKTETLRQLEEELKGVKVSQKLLNELLPKSQEEAVAKAAGNLSPSTIVTFSG
ncbi:hypothetical protein VE03_07427 [Pseudogymnoascus sp. 23342-1-I1]|nr:hypothetical protein VE03_07427 [Pseudogymnoascus sp. 23342-1-I1]